jgi:hypothetical protein
LTSQAQYVAAERSQVWVNIGYRLSAFGFLACDKPRIEGNFGFKDQWMALEWIRDNIGAFGGKTGGLAGTRNFIRLNNTTGDPENIQVTGLSAGKSNAFSAKISYSSKHNSKLVGAHSVHQLLHHASRLPPGVKAPFMSAVLQSNAIV